jgi:hypothetical protein
MAEQMDDDEHRAFAGVGRRRLGEAPRGRILGRFAQDIEIPVPGEDVLWDGSLRADIPMYAMRQLHEASHRLDCTLTSLILQMMFAQCGADGFPLFYIRDEDLVADRRKRRRHRTNGRVSTE